MYDPICNQFFTTFICCYDLGKVMVINYYNLSKEFINTMYAFPDGTYTDAVPSGLICAC